MVDPKKNFLRLMDWEPQAIRDVVDSAIDLKRSLKDGTAGFPLRGKTIGMYFEKQSLRTVTTFQVLMTQLGGQAILLDPASISLGKRESVADVGRIEVGRDNIGARPALYLAMGSYQIVSGTGTMEDPFAIVPADAAE